MNCLEFQRRLNAAPRRLGAEAEAHAETCPDCARRYAKQMRLEAELAQALLVAPPEGLADRVLLATQLRQRREHLPLYALAASLVLAVGIGFSLPSWHQEDLAGAGIAHVLREPNLLAAHEVVSHDNLSAQFARVGARLSAPMPAVHAGPCEVPGGDGAHIVLETPHGRVTVLLMPHREAREAASKLDRGLIAVVHGAKRGCYTLVAENARALEFAQAMLEARLSWT